MCFKPNPTPIQTMHRSFVLFLGAALASLVAFATVSSRGADDKVISDFMKKYHKAPQGTDPTCKKVGAGTATDAELAELLKGYQDICAIDPPKGEKAAWVEKCQALVKAVKAVQAKETGAADAYKKAVNCKSCHSVHKPD